VGNVIRHGYRDGSHSEIEVAENTNWTASEIKNRGLKLLTFLEKRWAVRIGDEERKLEWLHLKFLGNQ